VLQSLTAAVSDDTIILFVTLFILLHLFFYDYEINKRRPKKSNKTVGVGVGSPTSLNAIFFAAILLASRLSQINAVFVLVFQSLLIFGFGPYFRQNLRQKNRTWYEAMAIGTTVCNLVSLVMINVYQALGFLAVVTFMTLAAPLIFIYVYGFKNDIRGPWDMPDVK